MIAFDRCVLDTRARELRRDGVLRPVEPKVFDLIALLVTRHRDTVTKDELVRTLWAHQAPSDSALARAVLRAREALGDPALIKTVHRVGYRFTGRVDGMPSAAAPPLALRIGLLPVDNRSGDAQWHWVELGLPALVQQRLELPGRLAVAPMAEMLVALSTVPAGAEPGERIDAACRLLGLGACVQATLRRQGPLLWLDYRLQGEAVGGAAGSVGGADAAELGTRLADALRGALLPPGAAEPPASAGSDPFLQQAYARAAQLAALHQFRAAAKLLDVVLEFEPEHPGAALAQLQALANLADPAALPRGQALLERARAAGDTRLQALALAACGQVRLLAEQPGTLALARRDFEAALDLAAAHPGEDWVRRLPVPAARAALLDGDAARARELLLAARGDAHALSADPFHRALVLDNRAWVERSCGRWMEAYDLVDQASTLYLAHRLHAMAALSLMNQAATAVELGWLERGLALARRAAALLDMVQQPHAIAGISEAAAVVYSTCNAPQDLQRLLQAIEASEPGRLALQRAGGVLARGLLAQAQGRLAEARQALLQAVAQGASLPLRHGERLAHLLTLEIQALAEHDHPALRLLCARAEAAQALACADVGAARDALARALHTRAGGRLQALCALDAAWLALAAGERAAARALLDDLGPWRSEHPLGRRLQQDALRGARLPPPARLPTVSGS